MRCLASLIFLLAIATPVWAGDPIQKAGSEIFPSRNEISVHIGGQEGFGGKLTDTSGFKLFFDYGYRMSDLVWFNLQVNQIFGSTGGTCIDAGGHPFPCTNFYNGGWGTEVAVGVKFKIKTGIPLVVEIPVDGALIGLYERPCGDSGAAVPVVRFGGGVKYFVTRRIGLGIGSNFALGPGFHSGGCGFGSYVDFYGSFDFQAGAEFIL